MTSSGYNPDALQRTLLEQTIVIEQLITLYYFEFGKNYVFRGERHNFWEVLYVDRGEIEVRTDDEQHVLKQGSIIFHKPNEFHSFHAADGIAPNVIVFTFDCHSIAMQRFENKVIQLGEEERKLLVQMMNEGQNAFEYPFKHPLQRRSDAIPGSEQLLRCYLEILLISLLRRMHRSENAAATLSTAARENSEESLVQHICSYIEANLSQPITISHICSHFFVSRTRLQLLFRKYLGCTVVAYITKARIRQAKAYIREDCYNLTEISELLGFASIHYFSKVFKKENGMSPSEYARSVKARMNK